MAPFLPKSVFTPEYAHLTARIAEVRKAAGLTQAELAERLGRPQSYVSKYERGERRLDVVELMSIARTLGARVTDLIAELEQHRASREVPGDAQPDKQLRPRIVKPGRPRRKP